MREIEAFDALTLVHVKREYNAAADHITGKTMQREEGGTVPADEFEDLRTLNKLREVFIAKTEKTEAMIVVATRRTTQRTKEVADFLAAQAVHADRIRRAQDEEKWIHDLKRYLLGEVHGLIQKDVNDCVKIADRYEVDEDGLLFFVGKRRRRHGYGREIQFKLVAPTTLHDEILHHYHASLVGGHQGVSRTYEKVSQYFHWCGLHKSVQQYVGSCPDCETGKGRPRIHGTSPGNIVASYPFQMIGMDHIPSLPKSHLGNTELLV